MEDNLQRRRCPLCGSDVEALARLVIKTSAVVLERHDRPPGRLPADVTDVDWLTMPCMHPINGIELWDAVVEAGWGNDVAASLCRPLQQQLAA